MPIQLAIILITCVALILLAIAIASVRLFRNAMNPKLRRCEACDRLIARQTMICVRCGYAFND